MDFSKTKWTKVNLQYNRVKNQFQMVYSAKAIPLGRDENGTLKYKQVRKAISIPNPLGYHRTYDPITKQNINLPKDKKDHNKKREREFKLLEAQYQIDLTNKIYHLHQNRVSGERVYKWATDWVNNQTMAKNTKDGYMVALNKMKKVEDVHFLSFDTSFINKYIKYLNTLRGVGKLSQSSLRKYYERILFLMHRAEDNKKIYGVEEMFNKADDVPYGESEIGNYFSEEEFAILVNHDCRYPIVKRAFLFCCLTGLRINECMNLKWKDIKEKDGKITADVLSRKNRESQVIPVPNDAMLFTGERRGLNDSVFIALTYSDINNKLTDWVTSSGIERERVKTHDARRTCAYLLWKNTRNIDTCAKYLNHKNIAETYRYLKKHLGDAFQEIDANQIMPNILKIQGAV